MVALIIIIIRLEIITSQNRKEKNSRSFLFIFLRDVLKESHNANKKENNDAKI